MLFWVGSLGWAAAPATSVGLAATLLVAALGLRRPPASRGSMVRRVERESS